MEKVLVSIIMPFYNSGDTLKRAIELVLRQSYKNIELLLVDDGSTDKSGAISDAKAKKDNRIKVFKTNHVGTSSARNIALDAAEGKYIMFCDSDDWMPRRSVEKMVNAAEQNNSPFVCGGLRYQFILRQQTFIPEYIGTISDSGQQERLDMLYSILQGGAAKIFRRDLIEDHKIRFVPEILYAEDSDFANRYIAECETLTSIPDVVYIYNRMSGHSTCNNYMRHMNEYCLHAVHTRKLSLMRTELSAEDLERITVDALGRLVYSIRHYYKHCGLQCDELIRETWEMFKPEIDENYFSKGVFTDKLKIKTYLLLSAGNYDGLAALYKEQLEEEKLKKHIGFETPGWRHFFQFVNFNITPWFWRYY